MDGGKGRWGGCRCGGGGWDSQGWCTRPEAPQAYLCVGAPALVSGVGCVIHHTSYIIHHTSYVNTYDMISYTSNMIYMIYKQDTAPAMCNPYWDMLCAIPMDIPIVSYLHTGHGASHVPSLSNIIHHTSYIIHQTSYIIHHTSYIIHQI